MEISQFQELMDEIYGQCDRERGLSATVAWPAEEVGELAQAVRKGDPADASTSSETCSLGLRLWPPARPVIGPGRREICSGVPAL